MLVEIFDSPIYFFKAKAPAYAEAFTLERVRRIELLFRAWEARVMPLYDTRIPFDYTTSNRFGALVRFSQPFRFSTTMSSIRMPNLPGR